MVVQKPAAWIGLPYGIRIDIVDTLPDEPMPFMYVQGDRIPAQDLWVKFEWINGAYVARLDDGATMGRTVEIVLSQGDQDHVLVAGGITLSSDMRPAQRGVIALDSAVLKEATFCRFALDGDTEACGAFRIE